MKISFFFIIFSFIFNVAVSQTPISYQESSIITPIGDVNLAAKINNSFVQLDSNKGNINLTFSPYKYALNDLNIAQVSFLYKLNSDLVIGMKIKGNISEIYKELAMSGNSSYKVNEIITLGFNLNYNNLTIKNFNSYNQINFDLFSKIKFGENFSAGFRLDNLNRAKYSESTNIFQRFITGLGYNYNQLYFFEIASSISLNHTSGLILGSKVILNKDIKCKIALDTGYNDIELSILYNASGYDLIFGTVYNTTLGMKPNIELNYKW